MNNCRIPENDVGYCGIRTNVHGKIKSRVDENAVVECYYDVLPTNCVSMNFCSNRDLCYPHRNLAVFYGACLPSFERMFAIVRGVPSIQPIGELIDKEFKESDMIIHSKDIIWAKPKHEIKIASFDPKSLRIMYTPVSKIMRRRGSSKILEIETENGRAIHVTLDHPMIVLEKSCFTTKPARYLKKGDYIPVAKNIPRPKLQSLKEIDLIEEFQKLGVEKISVYNAKELLYKQSRSELAKLLKIPEYLIDNWRRADSLPLWVYLKLEDSKRRQKKLKIGAKYGSRKNRLYAIIKISPELATLLGYYLSEGYTSKGIVEFCFGIKEKGLANQTKHLIKIVFGVTADTRISKYLGKDSCIRVYARSEILSLLFNKILAAGSNCYKKRIPNFVYAMPQKFIMNLLDSYFVGDSHARYSGGRKKVFKSISISCTTASEELAYGIQYLLTRLGITPRILQGRNYQLWLHGGELAIKVYYCGLTIGIER
ncbi:MAG: LAGLIDADG family homing endonuclease [Thermoplasmatales archaeon]|nr:LAGLIDADG family homing endonuclease [Thermoplasmatales archaeon]